MGIGSEWDCSFGADSVAVWGNPTGALCWRWTVGNKGLNGDPSTHEPPPSLVTAEAGAMADAYAQGGQSGMETWISANRTDLAGWWGNRPAWQRARLIAAMLYARAGF